MNTSNFLTQLQTQVQGVLFISESEYPFEPQNLGLLDAAAIPAAVAAHSGTPAAQVKTIAPEQLMTQLERSADPGDAPIVANLQKIKTLYAFLNSQLSHLQVYRVATGVQVPIYILGFLPDQTVAGVKTTSIES
ncbi:MAG: nuclease A inhibitor family protein [Niabella sp.]|nr:nuclease A inhibitor family protein [Niabella sp.]